MEYRGKGMDGIGTYEILERGCLWNDVGELKINDLSGLSVSI
jgi:hypothetical protein